jgi:integrase/recombinase XerD
MTNELATTQPATNAGDMQLVAQGTTDAQLVRLWLSSGKRAGSAATQDTYSRIVQRFFTCVGKPLQAVTLTDLQDWRETLTGSAATQRTNIAAVRSLFAFAVKVGYLRMSPAVMLETPKVQQQQDARTLTQADTLRLFDACQTAQETALVRVLYGSGARVSEVLALKWQDVQPRQNGAGAVLRIRNGKGGKARQAGINAAAYAALVALRTEDTQPTGFVFSTRNGTALDRHAAHKLLKRVLSRAKLQEAKDAPVSCHWLRHTHATHAIAAGAPLTDVQAQLGHASLNTTTIYAHATAYSADKLPL